jgi:hypothetical protein
VTTTMPPRELDLPAQLQRVEPAPAAPRRPSVREWTRALFDALQTAREIDNAGSHAARARLAGLFTEARPLG